MAQICNQPGIATEDTGFGYTLQLIAGKYKMTILYWLWECQPIRYNELKRRIATISHKTLSLSLKELEADDLIVRREYPQIPPKVEYSLSPRGTSLIFWMRCACGASSTGREERGMPNGAGVPRAQGVPEGGRQPLHA